MAIDKLHPIAQEALGKFASAAYFSSRRFCRSLAELDPTQCLGWALQLVEFRISNSTPHDVVTRTLSLIRSLIASPDPAQLPRLDDLAWDCWNSGSFDADAPFLQRAVARLAWAAIGLVCVMTHCPFASQSVAISADAHEAGMATMVNQCAQAIDMTFTGTEDGRLMVAQDFTRQMEALS